ncbi:MAG: GTP pyrophosphokinase [Thermoleophilaceae bacterium]
MAAEYAATIDAYEAERPDYEDLAALIGKSVRSGLDARGLETVVLWRAKETLSFVKKALRKGYSDPMREIGDKAGVRVIVYYLDDVDIVEKAVGELCHVHAREVKLDAMDYDQLGYLGVHLEVQPTAELAARSENERLASLRAELQIHTKAQSAWAVVSHHLLYKTPLGLPHHIKRGITRLVALVELFDAEIQRFRQTIEEDPDFKELAVINALDDHIIRYSARRPDRALSALSVPALVRLHDLEPARVVPERIEPFLAANAVKLDELYARYRDDTRANPLLFQPEALLIFERFDNDPDHLRDAWPADVLPIDLLAELATIWGADIEV